MALDPQCIFCRIVSGEAEAFRLYRDPRVTAFLDIHPVTRGHLLVVPNEHFPNLESLDPAYAGPMMEAGRRLARALRAAPLEVEGINLHLADGAAAGQSVFHCHLHVIPRYQADGFGFRRGFGTEGGRPDDLEQVAGLIRPALGTT